jgi:hypothetical protein
MNTHHNTGERNGHAGGHDPHGEIPLDLPLGAMIRAAADGELSTDQEAMFEVHLQRHPEHAARVRFEHDLRRACKRVFVQEGRTVEPSAALRGRVEELTIAGRGEADRVPVRHQPAPRAAGDGVGGFRHRRLATLFAVLALFATGAVYFIAFNTAPTFRESPELAKVALVSFIKSEHRRCVLDERALQHKMTAYSTSEVGGEFEDLLGKALSVADLEKAGYVFAGAGRCAVPGAGASVHLVFRSQAQAPVAGSNAQEAAAGALSLFIQKDTGELPIRENETYRLETERGNPLILIWLHQGLIYYLVSESGDSEAAARRVLGVPAGSQPL